MWEGNIFSLSVHTRGVPQSQVLSHIPSPRFFLGGTPYLAVGIPQSQVLCQVSGPRSFLGGGGCTPVLSSFPVYGPRSFPGGYPRPGQGQITQDWGTPLPARTGVSPFPGTGYTAGGTPRTVFRRRTFLVEHLYDSL